MREGVHQVQPYDQLHQQPSGNLQVQVKYALNIYWVTFSFNIA